MRDAGKESMNPRQDIIDTMSQALAKAVNDSQDANALRAMTFFAIGLLQADDEFREQLGNSLLEAACADQVEMEGPQVTQPPLSDGQEPTPQLGSRQNRYT